MEIAIIGAGISGTFLAYKLSPYYDVTVFEKKSKIGNKPCSGLVSERIWNFLPLKENLILNHINHVKIYYPKKTIQLKFKPDMYVFNRYKLELYLHKLAKQNGAKFKKNKYISKISTLKDYDYIIGCDGAMSSVRSYLGLSPPKMRLGIYTHVKEKNYNDFVETWPTKTGFFWKIPRINSTEYGIINRPHQAQKLFNRFCKAHSLEPKEIKSHLIPTGLVLSNSPKIALCGDAAGLTKPWSGGGIIWSFLAADILAQTLPNTELYNKKIKAFFSKRIKATSFLTKSLRLTSKIPSVLPKKRNIDSDFIFKTNI